MRGAPRSKSRREPCWTLGTLRENFPSILSTGLDPARRGLHGQALGRGDYFARNASYSIRYCDSGSNPRAPLGSLLGAPLSSASAAPEHTRDGQMLVFAVLVQWAGMVRTGIGLGSGSGLG